MIVCITTTAMGKAGAECSRSLGARLVREPSSILVIALFLGDGMFSFLLLLNDCFYYYYGYGQGGGGVHTHAHTHARTRCHGGRRVNPVYIYIYIYISVAGVAAGAHLAAVEKW